MYEEHLEEMMMLCLASWRCWFPSPGFEAELILKLHSPMNTLVREFIQEGKESLI